MSQAEQLIGQWHSPTHQQTGLLSPHMSLDMALPTRRPNHNSTLQWANMTLPSRKPELASRPTSLIRWKTPVTKQNKNIILQLADSAHSQQVTTYPWTSWALALSLSSRSMQILGHPGPYIQLYQKSANPYQQSLGSLDPPPRLLETALSASSPGLTSWPGVELHWADNSSEVFRTLTLPSSELAVTLGPTRVLQPATLWPGPIKQQPAASTQGRAC